MPERPDNALLTALAEHTAALNRSTEASNRSAEASNQLSVKVDRLSGELHELRGRVETIEDANHFEAEVAKRLRERDEADAPRLSTAPAGSWLSALIGNPTALICVTVIVVVLALALGGPGIVAALQTAQKVSTK